MRESWIIAYWKRNTAKCGILMSSITSKCQKVWERCSIKEQDSNISSRSFFFCLAACICRRAQSSLREHKENEVCMNVFVFWSNPMEPTEYYCYCFVLTGLVDWLVNGLVLLRLRLSVMDCKSVNLLLLGCWSGLRIFLVARWLQALVQKLILSKFTSTYFFANQSPH